MKDLVLSLGVKFINVIAVISLIAVVLASLGQMADAGFIAGLVTLVVGVIGVTMAFFFIYLLIDIRDGIRDLNRGSGALKGTD